MNEKDRSRIIFVVATNALWFGAARRRIGGDSVDLEEIPGTRCIGNESKQGRGFPQGLSLFDVLLAPQAMANNRRLRHNAGGLEHGVFLNGTDEYAYLSGATRPVFASNSSNFSFEFRADSSDGALWWESDWPGSTSSDFLIIHLRKGQVNVAVNLGNDLLKSVSTSKPLDRGKWHRVAVERREHRTTVNVNGKLTTIVSSEGATRLNTNGLVYLGGRHGDAKRFRIRGTFVGCVRRVKINGILMDLAEGTGNTCLMQRAIFEP
ncbi:laminin G domain protein [Ancylostoma ceylanicum]|uniref:Laminin G domain protein n=1 Tax=Ancylostoma ceylanicum TaxID=53326 RepID=A0A0D6LFK4_9BILA|nr:laminin G domain protein [Ancylostoma ceylanicum]